MTDMANLGPALPQNTAGVSTSDNYTNKDSVFIIARDYYPACGHCANYEPTGCRREPSAPQFFTIERAGQCEACLKNTSHQSGTWGQFVESVSKQSGALDHAGGQVSTGQSQIGVQYLQEADGPREYRVSVPGSDNRYAAAGTGDKGEGPSERVTRKQFWMEEDDLLKPVENESKWPITLEYRIDETARKSKEKYGP
ncbi:MAG: hypothetical protein LQ340_001742 [Diploschistes diacapsis]|nr:MAG: hypothetical protein LQ340_001742 [Diploschistes diacapsis]